MNSIDTAAVDAANKALKEAYAALDTAESNYKTVKSLNGQSGYSIAVNGVPVDVAVTDCRTWSAVLIHGREMIHLGALKALQSIIDARRQNVAALEAELKRIAGGAA